MRANRFSRHTTTAGGSATRNLPRPRATRPSDQKSSSRSKGTCIVSVSGPQNMLGAHACMCTCACISVRWDFFLLSSFHCKQCMSLMLIQRGMFTSIIRVHDFLWHSTMCELTLLRINTVVRVVNEYDQNFYSSPSNMFVFISFLFSFLFFLFFLFFFVYALF